MLAAPLAVVGLGHEQSVPIFQQLAGRGVIRLVVMMDVRYPLSLRSVENLLAERGIDVGHETVRFWSSRPNVCRRDPKEAGGAHASTPAKTRTLKDEAACSCKSLSTNQNIWPSFLG